MSRQGILQLALVLVILVQGIFPAASMAGKVAMAMPKHSMPTQCAHMDSMNMGKSAGDCCGPGADCCRITTGNQTVTAWARTIPPRLVASGLLVMQKSFSAMAPDDPGFVQTSDGSPPHAISLYKAKNAFLI